MPIKGYYDGRNATSTQWLDRGSDNITGTFNGTVTLRNGYVYFNGGLRCELTNIGWYNANQVFSLTVIFRSSKSDANFHTLFSTCRAGSAARIAIYLDPDEKLNFRTETPYNEVVSNTSNTNVCDGKWYIAHCQRNGGMQRIYIDGVAESEVSTSGQTGTNALYSVNPLPRIGAESSGGGGAHNRYLTGDIMYFIHRDYALSPAEIKNEYMFYIGLLE